MPFPEDVLAPRETVRIIFVPHWIVLVAIGLKLVFWAVLLYASGTVLQGTNPSDLQLVAVIACAIASIVGLMANVLSLFPTVAHLLSTKYLVTTDRVFQRYGLLRRHESDIPILKVSSIKLHQGLIDRLFDYGDLKFDASLGESTVKFQGVLHPKEVRAEIYRLIDESRRTDEDEER